MSKIKIILKKSICKLMRKRNRDLPKKEDFQFHENFKMLIESNKDKLSKYTYDIFEVYDLILENTDLIKHPYNNCINIEIMDRFVDSVNNNINDYLRIISFSIEGTLFIQSLFFYGGVIKVISITKFRPLESRKVNVEEYSGTSINKIAKNSDIWYFLRTNNGDLKPIIKCSDIISTYTKKDTS